MYFSLFAFFVRLQRVAIKRRGDGPCGHRGDGPCGRRGRVHVPGQLKVVGDQVAVAGAIGPRRPDRTRISGASR